MADCPCQDPEIRKKYPPKGQHRGASVFRGFAIGALRSALLVAALHADKQEIKKKEKEKNRQKRKPEPGF